MGLVEGKSGLVTGAAGGLGRASAILFAAEGAAVVVTDLEAQRAGAEETVALIEQAGGRAIFVPADVTREADHEQVVAACVATYGRLDFAHNNAGFGQLPTPIEETTVEDWTPNVDVNMLGVFLGVKHQLRQMRAQGGGAIVNTASTAGVQGMPHLAAYVASKHGVIGFTKSAAIEAGDAGIRVNCILPGAMRTPMMGLVDAERQAALVAPQAIKIFSEPSEAAEAVVWLASDRASMVTGAALAVDRGMTAGVSP